MFKTIHIAAALTLTATLGQAAVTIGHVENASVGNVLLNNSTTPTAGQVVVGKFTGTAPTAGQWSTFMTNLQSGTQTVAQIYSSLVSSFGFTDVRSLPGGSDQTGFDWDWNTNSTIGGTTNVDFAQLGASQPLYLLAYNGLTTAASNQLFAGRADGTGANTLAWTSAAGDGGGSTLLLNAIDTASEVLIGFDTGGINVRMATGVPEPSRLMLLGLGGLGLVFRRRRC